MGVSRATLPQSDKGRVADQSPRTRYLYFHNSIRVGIALGGWNELSKAPVTSNPVVCFRFKLHSAPECRHGGTEPRTESCSANSSSSIVRFGTFELDLQTGELRHAGQKVKLQEQPFQVLATLLEHPGKIVTREELRNKLWREDTLVDFDHSLNAAIKRLRDALGESADAPVFIETLAR